MDIMLAILYVAAAQEGISRNGNTMKIVDPSPVKTVATAYGVDRRTVQGWRSKYYVNLHFSMPLDAATLGELMRAAGEQYQVIGRSQAATLRRGNKRRERN
jgi:hypothetical protein